MQALELLGDEPLHFRGNLNIGPVSYLNYRKDQLN
jgi:hypothetical protein